MTIPFDVVFVSTPDVIVSITGVQGTRNLLNFNVTTVSVTSSNVVFSIDALSQSTTEFTLQIAAVVASEALRIVNFNARYFEVRNHLLAIFIVFC